MLKLDSVRREYELAELRRADLADDPIVQFEGWLQQAIECELKALCKVV